MVEDVDWTTYLPSAINLKLGGVSGRCQACGEEGPVARFTALDSSYRAVQRWVRQ